MPEPTAQVSTTTDAAPGAVWDALTDPAKLKQFFFGSEVQSDFKVGSPIVMRGQYEGKSFEDKGEILAVEPERRLSFSHWSQMSGTPDTPENYHTVTFDLAPRDEGTEVTLTQANLKGGVTASDREHRDQYEKNWRGVLDGLAKVVGA